MTRTGLAIASIAMAAALTACSGNDGSEGGDSETGEDFTSQTGQEIADASKEAMESLDAVKVSGDITTDGDQVTLDIQSNSIGDCTGTIGAEGGTAEILGVSGDMWFKPDQAFWEVSAGDSAAQIIELVGDKWVVIPEDDTGFDQFCDVNELISELLENDPDSDSEFTTGDTSDLDGAEVVAVDRASEEDGDSTGYVLVDDPHYLVKIEKTDGEDTGTVVFSEFNEEFDVVAPNDDEMIDLDEVTG